jgi:hypothetical protein
MPSDSRRALAVVLVALAAAFAAAAPAAEEDAQPPGWERYVVPVLEGGGTGMAYFPTTPGRGEYLDPAGFHVHMTPAHDPGEERVFVAGEPFVPPPGIWRVWLQGDGAITPYSHLISFGSQNRARRVGPSSAEVGPGGWVGLPPGVETPGDTELWILRAADDPLLYEMSRRRPAAEAADGVLMPAGPALAALVDRGSGRWVALSPLFDVPAGRAVEAPLRRPAADAADLVVFAVDRPEDDRLALPAVEPTVAQEGRERRADLTLANAWGVWAVWYGLAPGPATLGGGSDRLYVEPQAVELAGGGVGRFEAALLRRPLLDVGLVLPREVREKPFELAVRAMPGGEELARVELDRRVGHHRFQAGLVAGPAEVVLDTHLGTFRRRVELAAGEETHLGLEPELIEVWGVVRHGGAPHPATVAFRTVAGDEVEAEAGEDGAYRALALQPLAWVEVGLDGVDQEPWADFLMPPLATGRELDFDLSDAVIAVRVVDAASGAPIGGAEVGVRSEYASPGDGGDGGDAHVGLPGTTRRPAPSRGRALGRDHAAGADGTVRLPPPRPGRLEIHATAEGYRPLAEPLVVEIPDPPQDREVEVALEPVGETLSLRLTLPDGSPAAGAEARRVEAAPPHRALSTARADAAGVVAVPLEPRQGLLLLRHPAAGFGVLDWARRADEGAAAWTFPPAAPPLTLRVLAPGGEAPARTAGIALWVDGRRLSDGLLYWLTGNPPRARGGAWLARGLPAGPVRVLAWLPESDAEAASGALDSLADEVGFPWPATVEIEAVR